MRWDIIKNGLLDELEKISEINLNGLTPDTIMRNSQPPPPMETPGYSKAKDILQRAEIIKTSSDETTFDKVVSKVGPTLGGAALGKGLVELASSSHKAFGGKGVPDRVKDIAVLTGASLGTANTLYKALKEHKQKKLEQPMEKKQEMTKLSLTPALQLKAGKQVGVKGTSAGQSAGPSIKGQTAGLIGRKFQI